MIRRVLRWLCGVGPKAPKSYHFVIDLNNGAHFDMTLEAPYAAHLMLQHGEKGVARA